MASREELLQSIRPDMRLDKSFFMKIYGYELTWPGFAKVALDKLEGIYILYAKPGEIHPLKLYQAVVDESINRHEEGMKAAAAWYVKRLEENYERQARKTSAGNRQARYQFTGFPEDW